MVQVRTADSAEVLARFAAVTLAELRAEFHARLTARGQAGDLETVHAA